MGKATLPADESSAELKEIKSSQFINGSYRKISKHQMNHSGSLFTALSEALKEAGGSGSYFVYLLNQPGSTFPESLFVSIFFR
jgi:hypothetical protein